MIRHVIKHKYKDGARLNNPELWCGKSRNNFDWVFIDAQHVALATDSCIQPCKNCIKAIIKQLSKEL